jgi:hypothetical protein
MGQVVRLKRKAFGRLKCSGCGAEVNAGCDCGKPYAPAGEIAEKAVKAKPEMSDRAIAKEIGVSTPTVSRARARSTVTNVTVAKRTGIDGKARTVPTPKVKPTAPNGAVEVAMPIAVGIVRRFCDTYPNYFDEGSAAADWLRKEIANAIKEGR